MIPGPAGRLEALLEWEPEASPHLVALVCHPHPLYGGTMHNKVVFRAAKAALEVGLPALRFNFRGVGKSGGTYSQGAGERDDARAALAYLTNLFPQAPAVMMGFSFGAWVGLAVGAGEARVRALVGMGIPIASSDMSYLAGVTKPKLIVQGTEDVYGPRPRVERFFASLAEPKQLRWVDGVDHFFTGKLDELQSAVAEFLSELVDPELSPRRVSFS